MEIHTDFAVGQDISFISFLKGRMDSQIAIAYCINSEWSIQSFASKVARDRLRECLESISSELREKY